MAKSFFFSAPLRLCASSLFLFCAIAAADEPHVVTNSIGMKFVRIPEGEFLMGSPDDDDLADADEHPQRRIRISRAFYLGQFEVTQQQYEKVTNENPSWFSKDGGGRDAVADWRGNSLHPVENVSWDEAVGFCDALGKLRRERTSKRTYRLPTEAEWEYACRAGTTTRFAFGDELDTFRMNVRRPPPHPTEAYAVQRPPHRGGESRPNAWGLYDMHGNVWEWCSDRYAADAYTANEAVDPQGPAEGTGRVIRGGDYRFDAGQARSANRDFTRQSRRDLGNGFRVVLTLENATSKGR